MERLRLVVLVGVAIASVGLATPSGALAETWGASGPDLPSFAVRVGAIDAATVPASRDALLLGEDLLRVTRDDGFVVAVPVPFPLEVMEVAGSIVSRMAVPEVAVPQIDPALLDVVALAKSGRLGPDGRVPVIVRVAAPLQELGHPIPDGLLAIDRSFVHLPLVAGTARLADLPSLALSPGVSRVYLDGVAQATLAESVPLIRADKVHERLDRLARPITGHGVKVAILDTGVDYTHPDLGGCFAAGCRVAGGRDLVNNDADPMDDHGHGTHVAATAAGAHGVAPGASILAYKVLNNYGSGAYSWIVGGIDAAIADGADVISMSLGGPGTADGALASAVDDAVALGVVVVSAVGNSGSLGDFTVGEPAASLRGIAVGSSTKRDALSSFSSRGPVRDSTDEVVGLKPDVVAPGEYIRAAVPAGPCALCDPSGYLELSGTSMATPHVSGVAALLLQARPSWRPDDVKAALMGSARDIADNLPSRAVGLGRVDALDALGIEVAILDANFWLGVDTPGGGAWNATSRVVVKNLGDRPLDVTLEAIGSAASPSVTGPESPPPLGLLLPGRMLAYDLTLIAPEGAPNGWHEGRLFANGTLPLGTVAAPESPPTGEATARGKFTFLKSDVLRLDLGGAATVHLLENDRHAHTLWNAPAKSDHYLARGNFTVVVSYGDRVVFIEEFVHTGDSTLRASPGDATRPFRVGMLTEDGTPLPDDLTSCSWAAPGAPCVRSGIRTLAREGTDWMLSHLLVNFYEPVIHVSDASERWSIGLNGKYVVDGVIHRVANALRANEAPADLTPSATDFVVVPARYAMPEGWTEGFRFESCSMGGFGIGGWRRIEAESTERFPIAKTGLAPIRIEGQRGPAWAYPTGCELLSQAVNAGARDGSGACIDARSCLDLGISVFARPLPSGIVRTDSAVAWEYPEYDDRYALRDGKFVIADGAPYLNGEVRGSPEHVSLWKPVPWRPWFTGGSGVLSWTFQSQWEPADARLTYTLHQDGTLVSSGDFDPYGESDFDLPRAGGIVEFRATFGGAITHAGIGEVSYALRYDAGATDARHPRIEWARVTDDAGIGTRFPEGAPLAIHAKVLAPQAETLADVTVRLTRDGQAVADYPALVLDGDLVHVQLADLAPGSYEVTVLARGTDGDLATYTQSPGFVVEA